MKKLSYILFIVFFWAYPSCDRADSGKAADNFAHRADSLREEINRTVYTDSARGRAIMTGLEEEARQQNDTYSQAFVKAKRVELYYSQFDTDSIFIAATDAEEFSRRYGEYKFLFTVQQIVIQRYTAQGEYARGILKGREMYEEARQSGQSIYMARATAAIANIYSTMNIRDEALWYYNECLRLLRTTTGSPSLYLEVYRDIANNYLFAEEYDKAMIYADSLQMKTDEFAASGEALNLDSHRFLVAYFRARTQIKKENAEAAREELSKADSLYRSAVLSPVFKIYLNNIHASYSQLTGDPAKALGYQEGILDFLRANGLEDSAYDYIAGSAEYLFELGKYREAAEMYAKAYGMLEESSKRDLYMQINELRTLYELDKLELEKERDRRIFRNTVIWFAVILVLLCIIIILVALNVRRLRARNRSLLDRIAEQDRLERENETLRDRMARSESVPDEGEGSELYFRMKELMSDPDVFTNPDIGRKTIAEKLHTNEKYVYDTVHKYYGLSVSDYITNLRLDYARKLLSQPPTKYTVEAVALDAGFTNRYTFHRLFKDRYGMTPHEFRRLVHISRE